jgi:hypothetical protein
MNKNTNIIEIDGNKYKKSGTINPNKKINPDNFSRTTDGIRLGILGGVGMALFLVAAQLMAGESMVLKFLKYIALFGALAYGLKAQKTYMQNNYTFKNGIQLGVIVTATSAITLALMNVFMFGISPELAFDKFSMQADSVGHLAVLSGVLFFEVLVFGMIITFIILQAIKPKRKGASKL